MATFEPLPDPGVDKSDKVTESLMEDSAGPNDLTVDDISSEEEDWDDYVQYRKQGAKRKRQSRRVAVEEESSNEARDKEPTGNDSREQCLADIARCRAQLNSISLHS